jgi:hypothetical protein
MNALVLIEGFFNSIQSAGALWFGRSELDTKENSKLPCLIDG